MQGTRSRSIRLALAVTLAVVADRSLDRDDRRPGRAVGLARGPWLARGSRRGAGPVLVRRTARKQQLDAQAPRAHIRTTYRRSSSRRAPSSSVHARA